MFKSFFLGGFECATGYNVHGEWFDQIEATQHDRFADLDYRLLRENNLLAARDGVRWPLVDRGGSYDFASLDSRLQASLRYNIDVVWDLFHYGYPDDLDIFGDDFPKRFADYCYATARYIARHSGGQCYFTPVNEPSYFAWAGGHVGTFKPYAKNRGWDLKIALARAHIAGTDAIRAACSDARIVSVDPMCRVVPPADRPDMEEATRHFNDAVVFESWDMISGKICPELGGNRYYLDILGINYYWTNQWELGRDGVPLADDDPRRVPLREIVREVHRRYGGDLLITESSHCGEMRGPWMDQLADECEGMLEEGLPLRGVCLYPILGMPEWHCRDQWARMGLWDLIPQSPTLGRVPCRPAIAALKKAQGRLEGRQWVEDVEEDRISA